MPTCNFLSFLPGGYKEMSSILADLQRPRMSPNAEGGGGGGAGFQPKITAVYMKPK
jgi:hypothetical protein